MAPHFFLTPSPQTPGALKIWARLAGLTLALRDCASCPQEPETPNKLAQNGAARSSNCTRRLEPNATSTCHSLHHRPAENTTIQKCLIRNPLVSEGVCWVRMVGFKYRRVVNFPGSMVFISSGMGANRAASRNLSNADSASWIKPPSPTDMEPDTRDPPPTLHVRFHVDWRQGKWKKTIELRNPSSPLRPAWKHQSHTCRAQTWLTRVYMSP